MRAFAFLAMGDLDNADVVYAQFIDAVGYDLFFDFVASYLAATGRHDDLLAIVDEQLGGLDALIANKPKTDVTFSGYLSALSWVYQQMDRQPEYEKMLRAYERFLESHGIADSLDLDLILSASEYAAISGDVPGLIRQATRLVELEAAGVEYFFAPWFRAYDDNSEFQALSETLARRANVERDKLGLGPFRPFGAID